MRDAEVRAVFDFSNALWTHLICLIPSYILTHSSVCTSDSFCVKDPGKLQNPDFHFFTGFVPSVPHAEDAAYIPAPADSLWSDRHKHNLTSSSVSRFPRRVANASSEILVGSAAVPTLRPGMVLQKPPKRASLKTQLVKRKRIWRNVFFQVALSQKQQTTTVLSILN